MTIGLEMTAATARGEKFDFEAREKADASKPKTRASVVAEMEAAIAASYPLVESKPMPRLIGWIDHQGEHYGKLVTAYRERIVPRMAGRRNSRRRVPQPLARRAGLRRRFGRAGRMNGPNVSSRCPGRTSAKSASPSERPGRCAAGGAPLT